MKIKVLSFAIISTLLLTACGGGDDSTSASNDGGEKPDTSANQTWHNIYIDESYSGPNEGKLGYNEDVMTLLDGKSYSKNTNTLYQDDNTDRSFIVTQDGVYEDGDVNATYGVRTGNITISDNTWTMIPYSKIGSTGLKFTNTYKSINLDGKSLSQTINPYDMWAIKNGLTEDYPVSTLMQNFYAKNIDTKFPKGSTCLQLVKESGNQEYIELQNATENNSSVENIWNKLAANPESEKKLYKDTTAYISYANSEADTFAKYKDKFFSGHYYSKGTSFLFEDMIKELIDDSSHLTGQDKLIANEYIDAAKNECMLYNDTASKTIHSSIQNFK